MKAWKTTGGGITSVVFAETRGRAKSATYRSANECGFDLSWNDIRAVRWEELDCQAKTWPANTPQDPDFVMGML